MLAVMSNTKKKEKIYKNNCKIPFFAPGKKLLVQTRRKKGEEDDDFFLFHLLLHVCCCLLAPTYAPKGLLASRVFGCSPHSPLGIPPSSWVGSSSSAPGNRLTAQQISLVRTNKEKGEACMPGRWREKMAKKEEKKIFAWL